jgi:hypothetical protein
LRDEAASATLAAADVEMQRSEQSYAALDVEAEHLRSRAAMSYCHRWPIEAEIRVPSDAPTKPTHVGEFM